MRTVIRTLAALLAIYLIVFFFLRVIPGDPVEMMLGERASAADVAALRASLGTDQPMSQQLVNGLWARLSGDFGVSYITRRPVADMIMERVGVTASLAFASIFVALLIAFPLGIAAAIKRGKTTDRVLSAVALSGVSVPNFWLGPMLILLFSVQLGWLPTGGLRQTSSWILPAITLGTALAAMLTRMLRASVIEASIAPHTRTAHAKGLGLSLVWLRHIVINAMLPVLTVLGLQLGALLSGAVVTETIFALPGLGRLLVTAIQQRDYPVVEGCVLVLAITVMVVNRLTDIGYRYVDPRTREEPLV